jgi:hypothetical protein
MVKSNLHRVKLKHQASSFRKLWRRSRQGGRPADAIRFK